jgi:hypothetical protein
VDLKNTGFYFGKGLVTLDRVLLKMKGREERDWRVGLDENLCSGGLARMERGISHRVGLK